MCRDNQNTRGAVYGDGELQKRAHPGGAGFYSAFWQQGEDLRLVAKVTEQATKVAELGANLEALKEGLEKHKPKQGPQFFELGQATFVRHPGRQGGERLSRAERRRLVREKAKKFMKERVRRRPGKQPGTPGGTLARSAQPDRSVVHVPGKCRSCGGSLAGAAVTSTEVR